MTRHAIERAKERYKLDLTYEDLGNIIALIQEGHAKFSHKNGALWIYRLRYKHILVVPVLSENKLRIITFNPIEGKAPKFVDKDGLWKQKRLKGKL
jgi:hypothetical protein